MYKYEKNSQSLIILSSILQIKICVSFLNVKILLDRKKAFYEEQNLMELFKVKGFDPCELILGEEKGNLPLYLFDNEDFETRTPSQW